MLNLSLSDFDPKRRLKRTNGIMTEAIQPRWRHVTGRYVTDDFTRNGVRDSALNRHSL